MPEQNQAIVPVAPAVNDRPTDPLTGVRHLAYAWVGLWSVALEDLGAFYQRCVARGEQALGAQAQAAAQPEVKSPDSDVDQKQLKAAARRRIQPTTIMNAFGAVESYHIDLNAEKLLPTKEELDALAERIEVLTREVEALARKREQP